MTYLTQYRYTTGAVTELFDDVVHPQKANWYPETYKRAKSGLIYPPHKMVDMLLDEEFVTEIRESKFGKTAFILAAGNSHFAGINQRTHKPNRLIYEYKFLPLTLTQVYAGRTAQAFGAHDLIMTDATACVSGMKAFYDAHNLLENRGFERVVVLAIEDQVNNSVLEFFGDAKACLTWEEEQKGVVPSAFDSHNGGFYVAQGAAVAVFERNPREEPMAQVVGCGLSSEECTNAMGQREDGEGYIRAIEEALWEMNTDPREISVIKTHGTGTKSNNIAERNAIETVFKDFVATSYKPSIGHTMGVSGLMETCMLLDDMGIGKIPGIANRTEKDERFLSEDIEDQEGLILSLAAGMGNIYSAVILDRRA